jgi:hypothetical protein
LAYLREVFDTNLVQRDEKDKVLTHGDRFFGNRTFTEAREERF